jgi:dipeptidyl aminopeptidase/acylaminoacyl peptidase
MKFLLPSDSPAVYVPEGYLLFLRQGKFMCQKFDVKRMSLEMQAVSFPGQVWTSTTFSGLSAFSASENVLAYRGGSDTSQLHWYDRTGKGLSAISTPGQQAEPFFSPDEKRVVLNRNSDLWILELASGAYSRFTFDPSDESTAIWSPDGRTIVFTSSRNGAYNLYRKPSDGSTEEEMLLTSTTTNWPDDWSKDGRFIIYENVDPKTRFDLWILPIDGDKKPVPYLRTQFNEAHSRFSPNGRWVAYVSDESGRGEVYVRSFPAEKGGKWQVSTSGGDQPTWRRDGGELFFMAPDRKLMSVKVDTDSFEFKAALPIPLFQTSSPSIGLTSSRNHYLVSASGDKFLVNNILQETASTPITVVLNWTAEMKQK